ncbi:MAG TPA: hypothetical protein VGV85_08555 [Longimicrobiaceae bacterium]|nr:hypothetical protein [Longimicrobiaceae bacterium]
MLGKYIDGLPDRAKDRIIMGERWVTGMGRGWRGGRCLIGHAEDWNENGMQDAEVYFVRRHKENPCDLGTCIGWRFDRLVQRFGKDRVVRACKLRAARGNAPALPDAPLAAASTA